MYNFTNFSINIGCKYLAPKYHKNISWKRLESLLNLKFDKLSAHCRKLSFERISSGWNMKNKKVLKGTLHHYFLKWHFSKKCYRIDVKSIIILYDDTEVFERHHVALKINNHLRWPGASRLGRQLTIKHSTTTSSV